jgi:hypothetical protein
MTFCKDAKDFCVESVLGKGCNGVVFSVKCVHPDFPASFRDKVLQASRCASLSRRPLSPPMPLPLTFVSHSKVVAVFVCLLAALRPEDGVRFG